MSKTQMENEKLYQGTMIITKKLLNEGVIDKEEYCEIDTKFREKYDVSFSTLLDIIKIEWRIKRYVMSDYCEELQEYKI